MSTLTSYTGPNRLCVEDQQFNSQSSQYFTKLILSMNCDVDPCLIPHSDPKPLIATHIKAKWHDSINELYDIEPSVGKPPQIH